jgi:autotransporter translocation and assembly factor TamB
MRVVRRMVGVLLAPIVVLLAVVVGTVVAVVLTPAGHALLARAATRWISSAVAGDVQIGAVRGNIWSHVELDDVTIHDRQGDTVLTAPLLSASYLLPGLLAHRLVFNHVRADSLRLHLVRSRSGHWNYETVFHMGTGPAGTAPPPHVALVDLQLRDAAVRIDVPTTPGPPRRPVSRNGRAPAQPRVVAGADGPVRVYTASGLNANLALLRISTPHRDPILARVNNLQLHFSDPDVTVTQLAGTIVTGGDSLRFALDSAALPATRLKGGGVVRWPGSDLLFDFALDVPQVALRDLWWIQPDFPDWTGSGRVIARSVSASRTDYSLDHLHLSHGNASLAGAGTIVIDNHRGLGMRDLDLQLHNTPIGLLGPYLDTLPVAGGLTGRLTASGFLDSLRLGGDLLFADALVPGTPVSHLRIAGLAQFGGPDGAVFQQFALRQSTIALGTVHQLVPSILLRGILTLDGQLDGPWKNAHFVGTVAHTAPDGAISRLVGSVRLDTRHTVLGLGLDADLDELSFDALRSGYPGVPSVGGLRGHVVASGNLDSLELHAALTGEVGSYTLTGRVRIDAPTYGADSLIVQMQRADVAAILGKGTSTSLNGRVVVGGIIDSTAPPQGTVTVALDQSRFGGATVDGVTGILHAAHGLLSVDTASVAWREGRVDAHGTLGWAAPDSGTLLLHANVTSLAPFDSLVRSASGVAADTAHPQRFDGRADATLAISGSLDAANVQGAVHGTDLVLDSWHVAEVDAQIRADSLGARHIAVTLTADTVGHGDHVARAVHLTIAGKLDSLAVAGSVGMVGLDANGSGVWERSAGMESIRLDALALRFPHQSWQLTAPARIAVTGGQVALADTVGLMATDGSGTIQISGTVPSNTPGRFDAHVRGLDLLDIFGVIESDTTALDGAASVDLHLAGTRDAPVIQGLASITSPVIGDVHAPTAVASFNYAAQRLHSTVTVWRAGQPVLAGTVSLPLDLALAARTTRKLPGELQISGLADSVDMATVEALVPSVTAATGNISLRLKGSGTWQEPRLEGVVDIHDVGMSIPSLNVHYGPINGHARFTGDSLVVDSLHIVNADGSLDIKGDIRFAELAQPSLDLQLRANQFLAIDAPDFLTLRATGNVQVKGPLLRPVMTGTHVVFTRSVFYFADLLTKNVVDLEDPENAALIDTTALRREGLRNDFASRFLDSLRINRLGVRIGDDVWLRSAQANIQLDGALTVDKDRKAFELTGTLNAPRGIYTLQLGPINRDFTVDEGTVTYYGTPDQNAGLSIKAHNQVRTIDGDDFNVIATITGTVQAPKVDLSAPGRNLTERDLLSYVLFGRSEFQLAAAQQNTDITTGASSVLTAALNALSGVVSQSLLTKGSGIGLSTLTIQPGATPGAITSGSSVTQLAAGLQFGPRTFVTFDAGICLTSQSQSFQKRNFGASIEYRFSREFRIQAAAEPVQSCITNRAADVFTTLSRYQLGGDLLWQRDY